MILKNRTYAPISDTLKEQLMRVEPSVDMHMEFRPCKVTLKNGEIFERVYVCESNSYIKIWGVWPEDDRGKRFILIQNVADIEESKVRMPVRFANQMYEAGESGMGYCIFTLVLKDGRKLPYLTGGAVDFVNWPPNVEPEMVAEILPHQGKEIFEQREADFYMQGAKYYWCLYSNSSD